jgi:histidinol-phosphate aminotransferase
MTPPFTRVLSNVPAVTPFVGPETLERRRGRPFRLRLGANESAFGVSPRAKAAMAAELDGVSWYCDPEHFDLRGRLASPLGLARENIVIGEGIDGLLGVIVRAFVDPGEAVVTSAGAYPTFNYHVIGYGGRLVFVPYTPDSRNDLDALVETARREDAKLLYLANPDNPTGSFLPGDTVDQALARLPDGCLLVLDEAYAEFAPPDRLPSVAPDDPRVIRLRTFSKAHGMAGLRIGYGIAAPEIVAAFDKIRLHFGVGRLSQVAALASLDDPDFAAGVVREVAKGRRDYEALGRALQLGTLPSLTNFVAFDLESAGASDRMVVLLDERDVFVRKPGVAPLDRFVRVTVGTAEERAGFAEAFGDAVKALRAART